MSNSLYQCSPFLVLNRSNTNKITIYNVLTKQLIPVQPEILSIIEDCRVPRSSGSIIDKSSDKIFKWLVSKMILIDQHKLWTRYAFTSADIEINTACNWRCDYCPVKNDPKPFETMEMDIFNEIIDKLKVYGIDKISLNSFNEPTIDPFLHERIEKLKASRLNLILYTNGSYLKREVSLYLKSSGVLKGIYFNLPSIDPQRFYSLTGWKNLEIIIQNLEAAIKLGLPVHLSIQGTNEEIKANLPEIVERYQADLKEPIKRWETCDRAGLLQNRYSDKTALSDKTLYGCIEPITCLCINVKGDLFLCCNDYYQKTNVGNIRNRRIEDIMQSDLAVEQMKKVFGASPAEKSFLCRSCKNMALSKKIHHISRQIKPIF